MAGTDATDYAPYSCNLELLAEFLMNQHYYISHMAYTEYGFYWLPLRSNKTILDEGFSDWKGHVKNVKNDTIGVGCYTYEERGTNVYFCVFQLRW
ncbi:hypothetical protein OESDEN_16896 [Oesophagostomum dentatum]|uniref:Uncharacterized protein n=1 Tax=Oesophagostomum dentatum TaxID=61180 RepID=A0A0B1SIP5_OESDE|nr:hypothetical protein OESDEN_16896 [Oesophagostomum dentatum]